MEDFLDNASIAEAMYLEDLKTELAIRLDLQLQHAVASAELKAHKSTLEYAYSMGSGCDYNPNHPIHKETQRKTEQLQRRLGELTARLAEFEQQQPNTQQADC